MSIIKLHLIASPLSFLPLSISCIGETEKRKTERNLRHYVERDLDENESFDFNGTFHRRDNIFMETNRPSTEVIYIITNRKTGNKTGYSAEVIFSEGYATILCLDELDFEQIEYSQEKVPEKVKIK